MSTKRILLTGARAPAAVEMARMLKIAGCHVVTIDSISPTLTQFSSCVDRHFTLPKPSENLQMFTDELIAIIKREQIDMVIPICEEVVYLSKIGDQLPCELFTMGFELVETIHNKWSFSQLLDQFEIATPKTWLIKNKTDLQALPRGKKIFKKVYSRFAAGHLIQKGDETLPELEFERENPYIAQEFIEGDTFCSYSIAKQGQLTAHAEYRVLHSIGFGSGISFVSTHHEKIKNFVTEFTKKTNYTGQISFDFILGKDGRLYCIECNPRATSGIHLFEKTSAFAEAILGECDKCLIPKSHLYKRDLLLLLWYGMKQGDIFHKPFWKSLILGKNPLIWKKDLKPIFSLPYVLSHIACTTLSQRKGLHEAMSRDVEYNGVSI